MLPTRRLSLILVTICASLACAPNSPARGESAKKTATGKGEPALEVPMEIVAPADPSPPQAIEVPDFWQAWAKPGTTFVLHDQLAEPGAPRRVEIEVARVQTLDEGAGKVARLVWTKIDGDEKQVGDSVFDAVLLTSDGARIVWDQADPSVEALEQLLGEPMPYRGRPGPNDALYADAPPGLDPQAVACLRLDESVEAQDCPDTCDGMICLSRQKGVVLLEGLLAPEQGAWSAEPPPPPPPTFRSLTSPAAGPKKHVAAIREGLGAFCDHWPRTVVAGPWRSQGHEWIAGMCLPKNDRVTEEENDNSPLYVEIGVFRVEGGTLHLEGGGRTSGGGGVLDYTIPLLQNEAFLREAKPPCPVTIVDNADPGDHHRALTVFCSDEFDPLVIRLPAEFEPDCAPVRASTDPARPLVAEFDCKPGGTGEQSRTWTLGDAGFVEREG